MATGRAYWKGYPKLSLVTCSVALYPASSQADKTHSTGSTARLATACVSRWWTRETGRVVDKEQKGRGYEVSKGKYVEIGPEELDAVEVESTHTIDIDVFVPEEEIDKRYYERPYYIVPDAKSEEAFAVIRDAMKDKGCVALARIVFANREHIMAIEPWGKGLLGTTLRYDYEGRDERDVFKGIPSPRVPKEMVQLASHILNKKAGHFDPAKFKDEYELALRKLVKRKAAGKTIERTEPAEDRSNVIDLMAALQQSLGRGKDRAQPRSKARKQGARHKAG